MFIAWVFRLSPCEFLISKVYASAESFSAEPFTINSFFLIHGNIDFALMKRTFDY